MNSSKINKNIKNDHIIIQNNLITNFSPSLFYMSKDVSIFKKNKKQIYCKNFLIFILLIKYNKKFNTSLNTNIFIKKQKNKVYTIIRSPYRHKLARHQISFNRFFIKINFFIKLNSILIFKNFTNINKFIILIKKLNILFETNIISLENVKISFPFIFSKNFKLTNFFNKINVKKNNKKKN